MITIPPNDQIPQYDEFGRLILPKVQMTPPNFQQQPPVASPVANIQPQVAAPQQQQPDFSKVAITPVAPMPAEQQQANIQPINPDDPQFHNSKLRTVLNAIAGGLAGAAGGPEAGIKVGSALHDMKYNRAKEQQDRLLSILQPQVSSEKERRRVGEEEAKAGIQRGTAQSLAEHRVTQDNIGDRKTTVAEKDQASKDVHRKSLESYNAWKMANPKQDDLQYILSIEDPDEQAAAVKMIKEIKPHESTAEKTQAKIDTEAKPENVTKIETVAKAKGTASSAGHVAGSTTPEAIKGEEALAAAKSKGATHGRLEELTSEFGLKAQRDTALTLAQARSEGNTLTSNIKDTMEAAKHGLNHLPRIYGQIDQMETDGKLGPIMSKWSDFMAGKVGTDEESARLRFNIGLMDTLLAKAHGGARGGGSPAMMQHFASLLSSKNMDAKTLRSTLHEAEIWLTEYAKHPEYKDTVKGSASSEDAKKKFLEGIKIIQ